MEVLNNIAFQGALPVAIPHSENCSYLTSLLFLRQLSMENVWWFIWRLFENLCAAAKLNCLFPPGHWLCNSVQFVTVTAVDAASSSSKRSSHSEECVFLNFIIECAETHVEQSLISWRVSENVGMLSWCWWTGNYKQMGCRDQEPLTSGTLCVCQTEIKIRSIYQKWIKNEEYQTVCSPLSSVCWFLSCQGHTPCAGF